MIGSSGATKRKHEENGSSGAKKQAKLTDLFAAKPKSVETKSDLQTDHELPLNVLPLDGVHESWLPCFQAESSKPYYTKIVSFLESERRKGCTVFPQADHIFSWASLCPADQVKVVILGQDPYHDDGQAHGLAFSVRKGVRPPPSLMNIWKELGTDLGLPVKPPHGCLEEWARQGVLLLNTSLTVRAHQAASHSSCGWDKFTDAVIEHVSRVSRNVVFLLWGGHAQKREPRICGNGGHLVLKAAHPSPLSAYRGFFGCKHFSQANNFLQENGRTPIDWSLL